MRFRSLQKDVNTRICCAGFVLLLRTRLGSGWFGMRLGRRAWTRSAQRLPQCCSIWTAPSRTRIPSIRSFEVAVIAGRDVAEGSAGFSVLIEDGIQISE